MIILINLEPLHAGRHAINIANYINNSLDMARKYARIFVRGHYLFREAKLFPRGKLEENYELRGTAKGKYPGIFSKSNGAYCAYLTLQNFFFFGIREICQSVNHVKVCQLAPNVFQHSSRCFRTDSTSVKRTEKKAYFFFFVRDKSKMQVADTIKV